MEHFQTIFSLLAIIISIVALIQSRRAKKSTVFNEINEQMNIINNSPKEYGIKSPYSVLRGIKDNEDEIIAFEVLQSKFFNHLNLLNLVYYNRKLLGTELFNGYEKWIRTVLRPWIESSDDLIWLWKKVKETEDLLGSEFVNWLDCELNIYRDNSN